MRSASSRWSETDRVLLGRRANAIGGTVAVHVLLLLLLLKLTPNDAFRCEPKQEPNSFELTPDVPTQPERPPVVEKKRSAPKAPPPPAGAPPPPPVLTRPTMPPLIAGLENFDLRQLPRAEPKSGAGDQGQDSASAYGPGEGPGGARLYNAEWYREPTSAELSTYLPEPRFVGWGLIACQTIERYRVDNCRVIGDSPPGSGLARAIKAAAWQFMVRPPRIDGKSVIGAWVKIRIEFSESGVGVR
jgi:protein TonB